MIRDLAQTGLKGRTITPGTVDVKIPAGMLDAILTILGDPDLLTANIKNGANIFNVPGKASVVDTSDANAIAGQILAGLYAYVNGVKVTGTMANNAAPTATITLQGGTVGIPAGYGPGGIITANITGLVAGVITAPNVVGGVTGTVIPYASSLVAGATTLLTDATVYTQTAQQVYGKMGKRITVNYTGSIRLFYQAQCLNSLNSVTRIYKNGVAVGIARDPYVGNGSTWFSYTEDFACNAGDYFEVWIYTWSATWPASMKNFTLQLGNTIPVATMT